MPSYQYNTLTLAIPEELRGQIDEAAWVFVVSELRKRFETGNMCGACYCALCSILLFPIGILFGICCWPMMATSHVAANAPIVCINANNIFYQGRQVFEWRNDNDVLVVHPENKVDIIIFTQPTGGAGLQQVILPNGEVGYIQTGGGGRQGVPVMASASYAPPPATPAVVIVNDASPIHQQQRPQEQGVPVQRESEMSASRSPSSNTV